MFKYIILIILLAVGTAGTAEARSVDLSCANNPIYCAMLTLRPNIDKAWAMEISNYIYTYSKQYGTDPLRTVAIAMQESGLRNIHRKQDIVFIREECLPSTTDDRKQDCVEYSSMITGYTDLGLYQFHARTIVAYGMDALRLRDDLKYATKMHVILLRAKLKECADLGKDAWVCYHSRTPKYRKRYKRMVNRYYNRITK